MQITSLPAEKWAALTALGSGLLLLAKKLLSRNKSIKPDYLTRAEFHREVLGLTDRIAANHNELLAALARQGESFERRIDQLETNLARLDERTKL